MKVSKEGEDNEDEEMKEVEVKSEDLFPTSVFLLDAKDSKDELLLKRAQGLPQEKANLLGINEERTKRRMEWWRNNNCNESGEPRPVNLYFQENKLDVVTG